METLTLHVLIYGRSELIALALQQSLQSRPQIEAQHHLGDFLSLKIDIEQGHLARPQVIVIDQSSLGIPFARVRDSFMDMGLQAPLIVLDVYRQGSFDRYFRERGAAAYLPVESSGEQLFGAVQEVFLAHV